MQEHLRRGVVDLVGVQSLEQRDVVGDRRQVRQQLGDLLAAFAVLLKLILRSGQRHFAADEREPLAFQQLRRASLAVVLDQFRLVIEQIELRRSADHVQVDHVLRPGRKVGWPSGKRIWRRWTRWSSRRTLRQQRAEGERTQADSRSLQELAARLRLKILLRADSCSISPW